MPYQQSLLQKREDRFQHLKVPIIEHYLELGDNQGLVWGWAVGVGAFSSSVMVTRLDQSFLGFHLSI